MLSSASTTFPLTSHSRSILSSSHSSTNIISPTLVGIKSRTIPTTRWTSTSSSHLRIHASSSMIEKETPETERPLTFLRESDDDHGHVSDSNSSSSVRARFEKMIREAQDRVCSAIEAADGGGKFKEDVWSRPGGGGGISRVLQDGAVWEKAGVNVSVVYGVMPPEAYRAAKPSSATGNSDKPGPIPFFAAGISSVLHPKNPFAPTLHFNYRYFETDAPKDLRSQLMSGGNGYFATAQQARTSDPVYAMVQCRNYLSVRDCVACFDAAVAQIRNCSAANGARVIYDGCFLRYESNGFFDQTSLPGNVATCGNTTASQAAAFATTADGLLSDLKVATPKINGFFAAAKRDTGGGAAVYAVAQCAETVSVSGCQDCLTVAYSNIQKCPPEADGRAVDAGCFLRYSETAFFADNQTINLTPFLGGAGGSNKNKAIIGGVVGGGGLLLLLFALFSWYWISRKAKTAPRGNILGSTELQGPVNYNYKDLKSATKGFSEENKLGAGGFGDVYKGIMRNGNVVAVKKLDISSSRAKADFESEVRLISNVHHRNLVRLLGCCSKKPELLLVYEYMANGSLDKFLYGEKRGSLNWKQRFDIIFGIARGLAYLHEQYHVCIIHRDIKPSNILLDDDFQPKIADFGLARLLPEDQSHLSTKFAGTLGYTAPEYAIHGQLSEKVDTYSFGVVVLEIISGRRGNEMKVEPVTEYLIEQAWNLYESRMHLNLVDDTLDPNEYKEDDVKKVIEIALMCTQSPVSARPTMSEVVVLLLSEPSLVTRQPNRPAFIDKDKIIPADTSTTKGSSTSDATASFTEFTGR